VICASLWPDPADELCPDEFRKTAQELMTKWAKDHLKLMSEESSKRFIAISKDDSKLDDNVELRKALLDFIADFANWDNSTVPEYLKTSRALTQTAHEALGGEPGSRPLVVDPFAGGGAIPLEALRVGADAFASDLNPVAVLLNKVVLEYIPKYGQKLADEVRKWGQWIKEQAEKELAEYYPKDPDGATPIAYLWARTIRCEGPGCGAEVPLIRSLQLAKKGKSSVAAHIIPNPAKKVFDFQIVDNGKKVKIEGTVKRGATLCPLCGYTTPVTSVRRQMTERKGGNKDARLFCVVTYIPGQGGRHYRLPTEQEKRATSKATKRLLEINKSLQSNLSPIPNEEIDKQHHDVNRAPLYGMETWGDLFTSRQALANVTFSNFVQMTCEQQNYEDPEFAVAIKTILALAVDRLIDYNSSFVRWVSGGEFLGNTFSRQALSFVTDFAEVNPFSGATGNWKGALEWILRCIESNSKLAMLSGNVGCFSATEHILPDDSVHAFITDPPYYDSINYAMISDFFYVWLRRLLLEEYPYLFKTNTTNKSDECVVNPVRDSNSNTYRNLIEKALTEGRRILEPSGIGLVVFAHKSTTGWEAQLEAMINAGWIVTASWPIDSEMVARVAAKGQARLGSSIHLICRPRENPDGSVRTDDIGDWRDVLTELPKRIHEWMPRLAEEGVVGADAIFSCLGPALEIYSRYSSVEKASGEKVELKEYLEQVWAAVSHEALKMIFEGADASGFEEDARLTAMWLWTLRTAAENGVKDGNEGKTQSIAGYNLEYDAARKIAQGLGSHLEILGHLVKIKGDTATLLSAGARTRYLFGKDAGEAPKGRKKKKNKQLTFDFESELKQMEDESGDLAGDLSGRAGSTVLDKLHQSMILFGAGRGEALKRFLVDDGIGMNPLYWRLAQALSALYPSGTDEKRWVDGVLARKKGLGF
jgi:adenine-specific DNA methylase